MDVTANQQIILNAISAGSTTVLEISEESGLSKQAVSANMKPLREKGMVTADDTGKVVKYNLGIFGRSAPIVESSSKKPSPTVKKAKIPSAAHPEVLMNELKRQSVRPRDIVVRLVAEHNLPKKVARALVYDNKSI